MKNTQKVTITPDGPYLVSGNIPLAKEVAEAGHSGEPEEWQKTDFYPPAEHYELCRCGASKTKPYCDGSHSVTHFDGTETASREPFAERVNLYTGPKLDLLDHEELCSGARFCNLGAGTWQCVRNSDIPEAKTIAIHSACNCPAGRLVVIDKQTGTPIEPAFEPSISITEDPQLHVSGPLWLKGGVDLISADGTLYENRNRVTLCRCGGSENKPFCDGSHIPGRFNDGDESLKFKT